MDVTVIVPVYNGLPHLTAQLDALCAQSFHGDWDVIVVDNGSTDRSAAQVAAYTDRLPVRCVTAVERQGPAYARNVGARAATGQWLAFCDADDVVDEHWLRELYVARERARVVTGAVEVAELNPTWTVFARGRTTVWDELPIGPCGFLPFARSGNVLLQRDDYEALGGFDETLPFLEDVDLSWRAQLAGLTLDVAPRARIHYRYRPTALGAYRQTANYERTEVLLYQRYRADGAQRRTPRAVARSALWLITRAPYPVLGPRRRYLWFTMLGGVVGRVHGSLRYRTLYL